jgi:predicted PurR-regulated permease PerM
LSGASKQQAGRIAERQAERNAERQVERSANGQNERRTERKAGWVEQRLALDVRDPTPFDTTSNFWRATAQAATIVMCILMLGVLLYLARGLIMPILCAITVALTIGPLLGEAARRRIPMWLIAVLFVGGLIAALNAAVVLLAGPATALIGRAPDVGAAFAQKMHVFDSTLQSLGELQAALGINASDKTFDLSALVTGMLTTVTPAALQFVLQVVLFFATLFFFILARPTFRKYAVNHLQSRVARLRTLKILNDIEDNLGGYLIVVTAINLVLGLVTIAITAALGLPSPLLWGTLAFILNYVPYVGPAVMDVLLFVGGLLTFPTLLGALLPPAIFIGVTTIEGQFITPAVVGRSVLNLHPLAIFLSIAFWSWLWGPVGAFLATPILIIARVALSHLYPKQQPEIPG